MATTENVFTRKIGPMPMWVWLAVVGGLVLLYVVYENQKSASAAKTAQKGAGNGEAAGYLVPPYIWTYASFPPEGGGHAKGGGKKVNPGGPEKKGGGGKKRGNPGKDQSTREITVDKDETLQELADYLHWSKATLAQVEQMNKIQGGGELTPSTKLHKGQTIIRPLK